MNLPSLDKFEITVKPGGCLFVDSSLADRESSRGDIAAYYVPAARIADENGLPGLANMVMMGKIIASVTDCDEDLIIQSMRKTVPERRKNMFDMNLRAIELGRGL